jgi:hypothetical protein
MGASAVRGIHRVTWLVEHCQNAQSQREAIIRAAARIVAAKFEKADISAGAVAAHAKAIAEALVASDDKR